jgi:hypothetical protein
MEHLEPLFFCPLREVGLRIARSLEKLFDRSVMKGAVLPNIEYCEMETKSLHDPYQRLDRVIGGSALTAGDQAIVEESQILKQFAGSLVDRRRLRFDSIARQIDFGQTCKHRVDKLPPWLVGVSIDGSLASSPKSIRRNRERLQELGTRALPVCGEAKQSRQLHKMALDQPESAATHLKQTLSSNISCNQRVPVAISTDPSAKGQPRKDQWIVKNRRIQPSISPSAPKPLIQRSQHRGKHMGEVIQDVSSFGLDVWFVEVNLSGSPEDR